MNARTRYNSLALLNANDDTRRVFSSRIRLRVIGGSARWLQCGEAMADLLEAGIETLRQHMDVVAQGFRGAVECRIGHHRRRGEVVCQRDPVEPARRIVQRPGAAGDGLEGRGAFGKTDLE